MDPEMARQQRQEEALTIEAQKSGGAGGAGAGAVDTPLITRLFAPSRPETGLALIPCRDVAAPLRRPRPQERRAPQPWIAFAFCWAPLIVAAALIALAAAQLLRALF
jgi:hypothetical protein